MLTDVRDPQAEKAYRPIDVTEPGMVTDVRPLLEKAFIPIEVTEAGIVTEVRLVQ